jgi:hypothetical protein
MREKVRSIVMIYRWMMATAVVAGLAALLAGCPKPGPTPNGPPDASDAAPPADVSCAVACDHVELRPPAGLACDTSGACYKLCSRIQRATYRVCLAAARDCDAVSDCGKQ